MLDSQHNDLHLYKMLQKGAFRDDNNKESHAKAVSKVEYDYMHFESLNHFLRSCYHRKHADKLVLQSIDSNQ